ncbi:hypothetical protein DM872_01540 [Pseudomonas taiwanensis]|nr:hypothetical protein [Pseudomonas taiwanensis]
MTTSTDQTKTKQQDGDAVLLETLPAPIRTCSLLKSVGEEAEARQGQTKKRSLRAVNEHFESDPNDASATQVAFQQAAMDDWRLSRTTRPLRSWRLSK